MKIYTITTALILIALFTLINSEDKEVNLFYCTFNEFARARIENNLPVFPCAEQ